MVISFQVISFQGQDAKVINRTLYINNKYYNAQNIPKDLLSPPEV